ncbi:MAG TPA: DAK2 domain-containing protein [Candidatus Faeciplasma pullistercoris]|uniref:DAK2 domain-containing protein n=1 Tax=Candidatus Faeciplasma pullistercoris TaxID=2840800 RepID=A0A9D1KLD2_9FIRM|nr:DAK2 domain-containing protein [Candidatus Faeciplasma pullistercoris]
MITGKILRDAFISAANSISNNKKKVDELNVFPVPDGDTGTNMSMTLANAKKELELMPDSTTVSDVAKVMASGLLRGARGNSGVITSLLFKGFDKALAGKAEADTALLADALDIGVSKAYKAVMKPTEGTILTVARLSAAKAKQVCQDVTDISEFWEIVCREAEAVLDTTPELLPTLKKAGVVDAGGKGLCIIFRAMGKVFAGEKMVESETSVKSAEPVTVETFSSVVGEFDEEIHFTYCTEYIVKKAHGCDDAIKLRAYLETIGDCVVVVEDDEIIKVHVHTNNPGLAIEKGLEFGSMNLPKIENMRYQHEEKLKESTVNVSSSNKAYAYAVPENEYGFVAVASGEGIEEMFKDAGADCIVKGGQTMNPSTEDILAAIQSCPAHTVFVLPNNKNIIMAAEQAVKLADRRVCVLQTRTIPQGIAALLAFDPSADYASNSSEMTRAFERVKTGQITFAARDSEFDGQKIKEGEVLALDNGKLAFVEEDVGKAAYRLIKKLVSSDSEFITIIYGSGISEDEAEELRAKVEEKFGQRLDVSLLSGGQPVYYYIISVE